MTTVGDVRAHHLQVEHEVKFAHVAKKAVQRLHQAVDKLKDGQLILCRQCGAHKSTASTHLVTVHADQEKQRGIPPVDDLVVAMLHE